MKKQSLGLLAAAALILPLTANATVIFSDNFDAAGEGGSILNWNGGDNWTIHNGSVDLVNNSNPWGIECLGGSGSCVDLDGSTQNDGDMLSKNVGPLGPGDYSFSYWLSGNQRGGAMDMSVELATGDGDVLSSDIHYLAYNVDWFEVTQFFTLYGEVTTVNLRFTHSFSSDNVGIMLDGVSLRSIPEPATLALLGLGLAGMGMTRRRKKI